MASTILLVKYTKHVLVDHYVCEGLDAVLPEGRFVGFDKAKLIERRISGHLLCSSENLSNQFAHLI